jgi:hypothetical protein
LPEKPQIRFETVLEHVLKHFALKQQPQDVIKSREPSGKLPATESEE